MVLSLKIVVPSDFGIAWSGFGLLAQQLPLRSKNGHPIWSLACNQHFSWQADKYSTSYSGWGARNKKTRNARLTGTTGAKSSLGRWYWRIKPTCPNSVTPQCACPSRDQSVNSDRKQGKGHSQDLTNDTLFVCVPSSPLRRFSSVWKRMEGRSRARPSRYPIRLPTTTPMSDSESRPSGGSKGSKSGPKGFHG